MQKTILSRTATVRAVKPSPRGILPARPGVAWRGRAEGDSTSACRASSSSLPNAPEPRSSSKNSLPEAPIVGKPLPNMRDSGEPTPSPRGPPEPTPNPLKVAWSKVARSISSLPLAIQELAFLAFLSAVGTVIEQGKSLEYYQTFYPDGDQKVLGFVTWELILQLGLDHVYFTWYFAATVVLLGASLIACTSTRQWPIVKVAQRWRFLGTKDGVLQNPVAETLPNARLVDVGKILVDRGYQVFREQDKLYGFKGLSGRYAPIGVHFAIILTLMGSMMGAFGGWRGSIIAPEGADFVVASAIVPASPLATMPAGGKAVIHVNDFRIEYLEGGQVDQFYSDLSVLDLEGKELFRKTIYVNEPLKFGGVTAYQTDWAMAGLKLQVKGSPALDAGAGNDVSTGYTTVTLPMASLEESGAISGRAWGTFIPIELPRPDGSKPKGLTAIARDFQSVAFYNSAGEFAGVRRTGSDLKLEVDGLEIKVDDVIGSTGMELKADPGVPLVYAGFGIMMITTLLSYLTFSQVWVLQEGTDVHVGGKTNRATVEFQSEMNAIFDVVPEYRQQ